MSSQPELYQNVHDDNRPYLSFKLEDEFFAIPVMKVMEILEVPKITKIPQAPPFLKGVINLRGAVLPIIDTRIKFGMSPTQFDINTSILVLNVQDGDDQLSVGVLADAVLEVFEVRDSNIQPSPSLGAKYSSEFIEGMISYQDNFMMLLDIDQIFSLIDLQDILNQSEEVPSQPNP